MSNIIMSQEIELAQLTKNKEINFEFTSTLVFESKLKKQLNLLNLDKLKFAGILKPLEKSDWRMCATLGATVEQSCVLTLEPVTTRIDANFIRDFKTISAPSVPKITPNITFDYTEEILRDVIDLCSVLQEVLSLELPDYPKIENINVLQTEFGPPGISPLTDETSKPFAILSSFRDKLS